MNQDRNFDDIATIFQKKIYASNKGKIRELLLTNEIQKILKTYNLNQPLTILDAGGGQAQFACSLAQQGHNVIVCDISNNMLNIAQQNAKAKNVKLQLINDSIQNIHLYLHQPVDIILCHAVLEWITNPTEILAALKNNLKNNGFISLMFYNYYSLLFKNIMFTNFDYITQEQSIKKKKNKISPDYPRKPEDIELIIKQLNLQILDKTGIRVFNDYINKKDLSERELNQLFLLETTYCQHPAYMNLARYMHYIVKK